MRWLKEVWELQSQVDMRGFPLNGALYTKTPVFPVGNTEV